MSIEDDPGFESGLILNRIRMSAKMLWIHYLVGVSYFAKFCENGRVTDCTRKKYPKFLYSSMMKKMEK